MPTDLAAPPPAYGIPNAADAADHDIRWQAHLDAGRIGRPARPDPAMRANLVRTETLLGLHHDIA